MLGECKAASEHYKKVIEQVNDLNKKLAGTVLDFTNNHGTDRRVWSAARRTALNSQAAAK